MKLPIRKTHEPNVTQADIDVAGRLARHIIEEHPELDWRKEPFNEAYISDDVGDSGTLHLDDYSEIPVIGKVDSSRILQQRALLRACEGDWVAQSRMIERGFADYLEYHLGLGRVQCLYPAVADSDTRQIALECWQDRRLRHDLEQAIRHDGLRYIHPLVSNQNVWELALLLQGSTRMPVSVIGPPPALANWANDKIEFTKVAAKLLGEQYVPKTDVAYNFASLAKLVARLAETSRRIAVKFPYGTGGLGNFLIDSRQICNCSLTQIRDFLKQLLSEVRWPKNGRVLVDVWETDVINSPSVQTWIPAGDQEPVIEGLFIQSVTGEQCQFAGSSKANLPEELEQQIVNQSFLMATLFQQLGYVGRCSFDLILVGESLSNCRIEFIECNARWGGTSAPMTLLNRIGIVEPQTYCIRRLGFQNLGQLTFADLKRELFGELYNPSTGQGNIVLINPARIKQQSAIEIIVIANPDESLDELLNQVAIRFNTTIGKQLEANSISGLSPDQVN